MFGPVPAFDPLGDAPPPGAGGGIELPTRRLPNTARDDRNRDDDVIMMDPMTGTPDDFLPEEGGFENMNRSALLAWQERQRRQRTLRMLMMFLMVLLLMDGDEPPDARARRQQLAQHRNRQNGLRGNGGKNRWDGTGYFDSEGNLVGGLSPEVYEARLAQDTAVAAAIKDGDRTGYHDLLRLNGGKDVEAEIRRSVREKLKDETERLMVADDEDEETESGDAEQEQEFDRETQEDLEFGEDAAASEGVAEASDGTVVFHYPRNATGYYRGTWTRRPPATNSSSVHGSPSAKAPPKKKPTNVTLEEVGPWAESRLRNRGEAAGILFLPQHMHLEAGAVAPNNSTNPQEGAKSGDIGTTRGGSRGGYHRPPPPPAPVPENPALHLTRDAGRAAFQLFSRPVPAMSELSVVDGLVKLYDGMTSGFVVRRTDVLLRVRGVMIHGSGRMSLVTGSHPGGGSEGGGRRSVFAVRKVWERGVTLGLGHESSIEAFSEDEALDEGSVVRRRRRLQAAVEQLSSRPKDLSKTPGESPGTTSTEERGTMTLQEVRREVMDLFSSQYESDTEDIQDEKEFGQVMEGKGWTRIQSVDAEDLLSGDAIAGKLPVDSEGNDAREEVAGDAVTADPVAVDEKSHGKHHGDEVQIDRMLQGESEAPMSVTDDLLPTDLRAVIEEAAPLLLMHVVPTTDNATDDATFRRSTMTLSGADRSPTPGRHVFPYPYVVDDAGDTVRNARSPAAIGNLPHRELALEANSAGCEFEINVDVAAARWTYGEWRASTEHRMRMDAAFDPRPGSLWGGAGSAEQAARLRRSQFLLAMKSQLDFLEDSAHQPPREALVMNMVGDIESENCDFRSFVNVTAVRTNWEHTTAKAINYSFYMMLTCLAQIVVLLRQLLHTQAQSVATNVSLLCVGWQTVLDAMLCIGHIFLCLVMQPLSTAFASVAFFKLLIFCVIEMKYMAIIIQARHGAAGVTLSQDDLRRQITLLHLKFYGALMTAILAFYRFSQSHRTVYILCLYSFWVPQIIMNVITESRKPMHPYYVYGMSVTRMVAPIYVFAVRNNFLNEVIADFPMEPRMCQLLVLWIAFQTAVIYAQSKYGTRFMIPQRFLPPKFDYGRPIPASLLPRPANNSSNSLNGDSSPSLERSNGGARNRRGGGNRTSGGGLDSRTEDNGRPTMSEDTGDTPTLDCVICYNEIDVNDRKGYMLAPCDHIFHRHCLEQWMDVKMECPICRCNLPSL